jgi:hypothetical protein
MLIIMLPINRATARRLRRREVPLIASDTREDIRMDLPSASYLYALASIDTTFVGFSAVVMTFRQSLGGDVSPFDGFVTRVFIQLGFLVAAGSMLPPLLALCGWPHAMIWRLSSTLVGAVSLLFVVTYPARRRAASGTSMPFYIAVDLALLSLAVLALLANAAGVPSEPGAGLFDAGLTGLLFVSGLGYLHTLDLLYRQHGRREVPKAVG